MSTLRISNIEAKADNSSPTVDEQLKITNSTGDVLLHLDGRTSGITTVGINTTAQTIKFDENNNVYITGIVTATELHGTVAVGTSITYGDSEKAYFGTGLDLSIYHTGSHSYIEDTGAGSLYIDSNQLYLRNNDTSNVLLYTTSAGEVRINHNGNTKLTTTNTGVVITGICTATSFSGDGSALTGITTTIINNNASTKFITGTNTANTLDCEANLSYNNNLVTFSSSSLMVDKGTSATVSVKETAGNKEAQFRANTTGGLLRTVGSYPLVLGTNQAERLRIGSVGEIQIGTTSWPTGTMAKAAGRVLVGGGGDLTLWNETNSAGGVASFKLACKEGGDATKIGYVQFFGGTENTSDQKGFLKVNVSDASGSGQERLRITSAGRVGINETSPDRDLHVTGGTPYIRVESTGANASATLELYHTRGNGSDKWPSSVSTQDGSITLNTASGQNGTPVERLRCNNNGDIGINCDSPTNISDHRGLTLQGSGGNAAGFINFLDTADNSDARILASDGQLYIHADPSDNTADSLITFRVDNAEKARLTHDANFRINTMASVDGNTTAGLHVYNSGGSMASFKRAQAGAGIRFIHVNTLSGWIEFNSNNTVSYTSASDYRLKENNVDISDGIARVKNLKPYRFNWKAEPDKTVDGFFAHEAQEVVPESATRSKDRVVTQEDLDTGYVTAPMKVGDPIHQSMDNAKLVPLLTAALKEAIAKIEVLETKVAALESS